MPFNTTRLELVATDVPGLGARGLSAGDLTIDQRSHLLYLSDAEGSLVHLFDLTAAAARYVAAIPVPAPPGDLALATDRHTLYVSLPAGRVAAVELDPSSPRFRTVTVTIDTGGAGAAGAIEYATKFGQVFVVNPAESTVSVIDAATAKVLVKLDHFIPEGYDRHLERLRYHAGTGQVLLTSRRGLYWFDSRNFTAIGGGDPRSPCSGIAVDPGRDQALLSCGSAPDTQRILRWDFPSSKVVSEYDQVGGADTIVYSAVADRYFIAAPGFARGPVIGMYGGLRGLFVTNVPATPLSRSVAYDETNRVVYTQGARGLLSFPSPPDRTP